MTTVEKLMTAEEFSLLTDPAEGGKMELWGGKVVTMPPVGPDHGERAGDVTFYLRDFVRKHRLGRVRVETGYWIVNDPDYVLAPDISFVREDRVAAENIRLGFVDGLPDLAVEVTSPNDTDTAVQAKVDKYLEGGVPRVWVVRPALRTITVYWAGGQARVYREGERLTSADAGFTVEGLSLTVSEVFVTY
jgi:Uma2 family endonuclease